MSNRSSFGLGPKAGENRSNPIRAPSHLSHNPSFSTRTPLGERPLPSITYNEGLSANLLSPYPSQLLPPIEDDHFFHDRPSPSRSNKENIRDQSPPLAPMFRGRTFYLVQRDGVDMSDRRKMIIDEQGSFGSIITADIVILPFAVGDRLPCVIQNVIDLVAPRPCLSYKWLFKSCRSGEPRKYDNYIFPVDEGPRLLPKHRLPTPPPVADDIPPSLLVDDPPAAPSPLGLIEDTLDGVPSRVATPTPTSKPLTEVSSFQRSKADHDSLFSEDTDDEDGESEPDRGTPCTPTPQSHASGKAPMVSDGGVDDDDGMDADMDIDEGHLPGPPLPAVSEWLPRDEASSSLSPVPDESPTQGSDKSRSVETAKGKQRATPPPSPTPSNSVNQREDIRVSHRRFRSTQSPPSSPPKAKRPKTNKRKRRGRGKGRTEVGANTVEPRADTEDTSAPPPSPTKDAASALLSMSASKPPKDSADCVAGPKKSVQVNKRKHEDVSQPSTLPQRPMAPVQKVRRMLEEQSARLKVSLPPDGGNKQAPGSGTAGQGPSSGGTQQSGQPKAANGASAGATQIGTNNAASFQVAGPQAAGERRSWDQYRPSNTKSSLPPKPEHFAAQATWSSSRIPGNVSHWSQGTSSTAAATLSLPGVLPEEQLHLGTAEPKKPNDQRGDGAVPLSSTRGPAEATARERPRIAKQEPRVKQLSLSDQTTVASRGRRPGHGGKSGGGLPPGPIVESNYNTKTFRNQHFAKVREQEQAASQTASHAAQATKRRPFREEHQEEEIKAQRQSVPYTSSYNPQRDPRVRQAPSGGEPPSASNESAGNHGAGVSR